MNKLRSMKDFPGLMRLWAFLTNYPDFFSLKTPQQGLSLDYLEQIVLSNPPSIQLDRLCSLLLEKASLLEENFDPQDSKKYELRSAIYFWSKLTNEDKKSLLSLHGFELACCIGRMLLERSGLEAYRGLILTTTNLECRYVIFGFILDYVLCGKNWIKHLQSIQTKKQNKLTTHKLAGQPLILLGTWKEQIYFTCLGVGPCIFIGRDSNWRVVDGLDAVENIIISLLQEKKICSQLQSSPNRDDPAIRQLQSIPAREHANALLLAQHISTFCDHVDSESIELFSKVMNKSSKSNFDDPLSSIRSISANSAKDTPIDVLKPLLHELQYSLATYYAGASNSRYTTKQNRRKFRKQVDAARNNQDLSRCLNQFVSLIVQNTQGLTEGTYDERLMIQDPPNNLFQSNSCNIFKGLQTNIPFMKMRLLVVYRSYKLQSSQVEYTALWVHIMLKILSQFIWYQKIKHQEQQKREEKRQKQRQKRLIKRQLYLKKQKQQDNQNTPQRRSRRNRTINDDDDDYQEQKYHSSNGDSSDQDFKNKKYVQYQKYQYQVSNAPKHQKQLPSTHNNNSSSSQGMAFLNDFVLKKPITRNRNRR